ncbi:hypothetical protein MPSEU_001008400 [Mayamaea pseudoterrestris]|nr:hypothetical protein MPSEU_001008400 [Mayamaea pseudoterrestris]
MIENGFAPEERAESAEQMEQRECMVLEFESKVPWTEHHKAFVAKTSWGGEFITRRMNAYDIATSANDPAKAGQLYGSLKSGPRTSLVVDLKDVKEVLDELKESWESMEEELISFIKSLGPFAFRIIFLELANIGLSTLDVFRIKMRCKFDLDRRTYKKRESDNYMQLNLMESECTGVSSNDFSLREGNSNDWFHPRVHLTFEGKRSVDELWTRDPGVAFRFKCLNFSEGVGSLESFGLSILRSRLSGLVLDGLTLPLDEMWPKYFGMCLGRSAIAAIEIAFDNPDFLMNDEGLCNCDSLAFLVGLADGLTYNNEPKSFILKFNMTPAMATAFFKLDSATWNVWKLEICISGALDEGLKRLIGNCVRLNDNMEKFKLHVTTGTTEADTLDVFTHDHVAAWNRDGSMVTLTQVMVHASVETAAMEEDASKNPTLEEGLTVSPANDLSASVESAAVVETHVANGHSAAEEANATHDGEPAAKAKSSPNDADWSHMLSKRGHGIDPSMPLAKATTAAKDKASESVMTSTNDEPAAKANPAASYKTSTNGEPAATAKTTANGDPLAIAKTTISAKPAASGKSAAKKAKGIASGKASASAKMTKSTSGEPAAKAKPPVSAKTTGITSGEPAANGKPPANAKTTGSTSGAPAANGKPPASAKTTGSTSGKPPANAKTTSSTIGAPAANGKPPASAKTTDSTSDAPAAYGKPPANANGEQAAIDKPPVNAKPAPRGTASRFRKRSHAMDPAFSLKNW